jgi:TPR repeat protein
MRTQLSMGKDGGSARARPGAFVLRAGDRDVPANPHLRSATERACRLVLMAGAVLLGLAGAPAHALDPNLSPNDAFRSGYEAYKAGDAATALEALNFAAEKGHPGALWKLGRMYATGDLVTEDDKKALQLFARVANDYADDSPHSPDAPFVADAFVTLGGYYRRGIPGAIDADPGLARRYYAYAASYFGDPDAQFSLATMLVTGQGGGADLRQAARWFKLAARKGHAGAQAEFGHMLLEGIGVERRPLEGLMWISIARLTSVGDPQIQARHEQAFSMATEADRREAMRLAEGWISRRGGGVQAQAK